MPRATRAAHLRKIVAARGVAESASRAKLRAAVAWRKTLVDAVESGISRREIARHLADQGIVLSEESVRKAVAEGYGERRGER